MQSVEEIAAYYEVKPRPECPSCHSAERVAFIVKGRPTANLVAYSERPDSRSVEEIAAYYEANPVPKCPTCHSAERIITTVTGRPSSELVAYSKRPDSRIRLGGCTRDPTAKKYYCRSCQAKF